FENISIKIYSIFRSKKLNYIKDFLTLVHRDFLLLVFLLFGVLKIRQKLGKSYDINFSDRKK
ncbi:hypothetical protein, partial [Clostridium tyrobutyricum]|uniref:hypothetical protein n=1 Tax=Clostridium tyrobutyricum TaxID=1519 RepID=UPI001C37FEFA